MDVSRVIEESFKSLLDEKSYAKITVSEICERAQVSRKTFYGRFRDKEAIVEALFDRQVIEKFHSIDGIFSKEWRSQKHEVFYEKMYEALWDERDYYINLIGPMRGVDDTFIRVATNAIYRYNIERIPHIKQDMPQREIDYIAYFFASSQAMLVQKWISDRMPFTPRELAELYGRMTFPFWRGLVD